MNQEYANKLSLFSLFRRMLFRRIVLKKRDYNRYLPIADYLIDRWERAELMGFGKESSVYDSCLVLGDVTVGEKTWIGPYTILDGSGKLIIGNNCAISAGVHIYTHDSVKSITEGKPIEHSPVIIGNNVYIGPNVVISKGVCIGDKAIIGANSFVNSNVPHGEIVYGNPAKTKKEWEEK